MYFHYGHNNKLHMIYYLWFSSKTYVALLSQLTSHILELALEPELELAREPTESNIPWLKFGSFKIEPSHERAFTKPNGKLLTNGLIPQQPSIETQAQFQ